jgi:hypothetical protein
VGLFHSPYFPTIFGEFAVGLAYCGKVEFGDHGPGRHLSGQRLESRFDGVQF